MNARTTETEVESTVSRAEYDAVVAENAELRKKLDFIMGQVRLLKHKTFGSSSERATEELFGQISFIFNEAEAWKAEEKAPVESTTVAEHTRKKRSSNLDSVLPENIKVEVVEHGIPEEDRVCDVCSTIMERIGKEVTRTIVLHPATATIREDVYYTYACQRCKAQETETPTMKTGKMPAVIPGSFASPEAISHIMVQKFVMASPLYRQEQELNRSGIKLSRQIR